MIGEGAPTADTPIAWPLRTALILALVAPTLNMAVLPPALPMIADYLGGGVAGEITAQRAQSLPFLGLVIGGLLAGGLIARFGLRRCLILAALCFAAAGLGGGSARSAAPLLVSCFVAGLAASVLSCGLTTATGAVMAGDARIRTLGFQTASSDFSAIGGGIVAAMLAQFYGWRAPFAIYVGFGLLSLLLVAGAKTPVVPRDDTSSGLVAVARKAGPVYLAGGFIFLLMGTQPTLMPFHLAAHGLATPGARAIVLVAAPAAAMLSSIAYALIRGRIADRWMLVAATIASALGFAGMALWTGGTVPIAAASVAVGIGAGLSFPMVIRAAFRNVQPALHGYSIGLLNTGVFSGVFLSPFLFGPLQRAAGAPAMFGLCALIWLVFGAITASRRDWTRAAAGDMVIAAPGAAG
ncbi:MFS transporter [uncultured Sphingomonas sp.]|uniref:MFS transporter n=1 Tax=uncultured Sphingomonas sp. TaxID=158754 RepID=UPI0035C996F3